MARNGYFVDMTEKGAKVLPVKVLERGKVLLSETSMRILELLAEKPMYPKEVARRLRIQEQKVYYHMRNLEELGIINDILIIITSDHGESLGEHNIFLDHHGLYDVTIHVPLIFMWPEGFDDKRRIDALVQHVDIMPTILDIVGSDPRSFNLQGKSLCPLINKEVDTIRESAFIEEAHAQRKRAIRTQEWKYIRSLSRTKTICRYCMQIHLKIR